MKRERLVILLGALVALVFFYLGLNTWLKSKEEKVIPLPVVIKPQPKEEKAQEQQVQQEKPLEEEKKDKIAQKIEKEKRVAQLPEKTKKETTESKPKSEKKAVKEKGKKAYIIQIGAFSKEENAKKALKKAKDMGYKGKIDKEGELYKVRIKVVTASIEKDMSKLKSAFGGAVLKR